MAALAGVVTFAPSTIHAQTFTWNTTSSGNFSGAGNWLGGVAPPAGGSDALSLVFQGANIFTPGGGYTATNDLGNPFLLNALSFVNRDSSRTGTVIVSSGFNQLLRLTGNDPAIVLDADYGTSIIAGTLDLSPSSGTTTIRGKGAANLTIGASLTGSGGLVIDREETLPYGSGSVVTLNAHNTFTGGVTLRNGNLSVGSSGISYSLGLSGSDLNTLTVAAGGVSSLRFGGSNVSIYNPIALEGDLNLVGSNSGNLDGSLSGTGGLNVLLTGGATLTLTNGVAGQAAHTFTGATTIGGAVAMGSTSAAGPTLRLQGTSGKLNSTSSITVNNNATLDLGLTANGGRVPDTTPVFLNSGRISVQSSSETLGPVSLTGEGLFTLTGGSPAALNLGTVTRIDKATMFFRGDQLPGTGATVAPGTITVAGGLPVLSDPLGPVGGQNTGVVAFAAGVRSAVSSSLTPTHLVGYDAEGVRLLLPTDTAVFAQVGSGGTFASNVNNHLTGSPAALNNTVRVNSLFVSGATLTGTGLLQVYSGAVANSGIFTLNGPSLDFGANTGYLHHGARINVRGTSSILGSGGVVVSTPATDTSGNLYTYALVLTNTGANGNPFTGGLTINGNGVVAFDAPNGNDLQLGAAGQAITLGGGTLSYVGNGTATIDASRPFTINASNGTVNLANFNTNLTIAGGTGGVGSLFKTGVGTLTLAGTNNYTGETIVTAGTLNLTGTRTGGGGYTVRGSGSTLQVASPTALGSAPILLEQTSAFLANGSGSYDNDFTLVGEFAPSLGASAGVSATLSSAIGGSGRINKDGSGTITFSGPVTLRNTLQINRGTIALTGAASLTDVPTIFIGGAGSLRLDSTAGSDRLGASTVVTMSRGELRLDGAPGVASSETFGRLSINSLGPAFVTLAPGAGGTATLSTMNTFSASGAGSTGYLIFRGDGIGEVGGASHIFFGAGSAVGLLPNTMVDDNVAGLGKDIAYYDSAVGIRFPRLSDFTTGTVIDNGAGTSTAAWFRVDAAGGQTAGASNQISVLRLAPGATLNASSGTLNISSGVISAERSASSTITGGTLASGATQMKVTNIDGLTIGSALSSTGGFAKNGTGTLDLTGAFNISGSVFVNVGALNLNGGDRTLSGVNFLSVQPGASLNTDGALAIGSSATLRLQGDDGGFAVGSIGGGFSAGGLDIYQRASLNVAGPITLTGSATVYGGTLITTGGTLTAAGSLSLGVPGGGTLADADLLSLPSRVETQGGHILLTGGLSLSSTSVVDTGGGNLTAGGLSGNGEVRLGGPGALTVNQASDGTYSGSIIGGSSFTKSGAGTLTLAPTAPLNYTGATSISAGRLTLDVANILPTSTVLNIGAGASFDLNGNNQTVSGLNFLASGNGFSSNTLDGAILTLKGDISFGPSGNSGARALIFGGTGGAIDLDGAVRNIAIAGNGTGAAYNASSYDLQINAGIRNGGINFTGTPATGGAPGVLVLSGDNSYTGGTTINQGVLRVTRPEALPAAGVITFGTPNSATGGTLDLGRSGDQGSPGTPATFTVAGLAVSDGNTAGASNRIMNSSTTNAVLVVNNAEDYAFSGAIAPDTTSRIALTKAGSGVLTLSGAAHTYTGATTINSGVLNITGALATGSAVTVNAGGTLSGDGSVGVITLKTGGSVAGGDLLELTPLGDGLSATSLLFDPGAQLLFRLGANTAGSDKITLSSGLFNGSTGEGDYIVGFSDYGIDLSSGPVTYDLVTFNDTVAGTNFSTTNFRARGVGNVGGVSGFFNIANPNTDSAILQYMMFDFSAAAIPEPGSAPLAATGAALFLGLSWLRSRRRQS